MINVKISPSVLSVPMDKIGDAVKDLKKFGADYVHCDCLDGVFAPNTSDGIKMVKICKANSELPLDVHLMIMNPDKYIKDYVDAGADIITFHESACTKTAETLDLIHSYGKKAGLVLNPDVEVKSVIPYLDKVDVIMLMGVFPGFSGQKFIEYVLDKIVELKKIIGNRNILIELDGGVKSSNIKEMVDRGVDICVGGSSVFNAPTIKEGIDALKNAWNIINFCETSQ